MDAAEELKQFLSVYDRVHKLGLEAFKYGHQGNRPCMQMALVLLSIPLTVKAGPKVLSALATLCMDFGMAYADMLMADAKATQSPEGYHEMELLMAELKRRTSGGTY